jgi:hypothetical protein
MNVSLSPYGYDGQLNIRLAIVGFTPDPISPQDHGSAGMLTLQPFFCLARVLKNLISAGITRQFSVRKAALKGNQTAACASI